MAIQPGRVLKNRYRVEEALGRGGMADVYRVYDLERGVPLAMKVLREDLAEDRVFLRRFQREAQNLAKLQHPNIVRFYGIEQEDFLVFILMDYIDGPTLRRLIFSTHEPLSNDQVLQIMKPICSALHYAHSQGIVHCDLKSANIMLDKNSKSYLTDFGIARMTDMATSTMVGAGTPAYMAPELILGQDPTPQADIYAIGIVLYEMFTGGERPFKGEQAEITGTIAEKVRWEQVNSKPSSILDFNSNVPSELDELVQHCLAKEMWNRPKDADEVIHYLEKILANDCSNIFENILENHHEEIANFGYEEKLFRISNEERQINQENLLRKRFIKEYLGIAFIFCLIIFLLFYLLPAILS